MAIRRDVTGGGAIRRDMPLPRNRPPRAPPPTDNLRADRHRPLRGGRGYL